MTFFTSLKKSPLEQGIATATKIIVPLYVVVIMSMHSVQAYKWYQLSQQKNNYKKQTLSFENITKDHHEVQKEKLLVQEKIAFLNQQKKESREKYEQLKNIYYNPQEILTAVTIKNNQFSCSCSAKTTHKAHEFLKGLKVQPLVHKARIIHLTKNSGQYAVEIKGRFTEINNTLT